ncbi:MAG: hypothetical protein Q9203_000581 [Teloschistes exilis]
MPSRLQKLGIAPGQALADTYYVAGATAIVVSIVCHLGLREKCDATATRNETSTRPTSSWQRWVASMSSIPEVFKLGVSDPSLGLGLLASFVARSSSVGISLFIPLFVNADVCNHPAQDVRDVKEHCRKAYVIAAQLSGVSQLFALVFAPIFGYLPCRRQRVNVTLTLATLSGVGGYVGFAKLNSSTVTPVLILTVALLGISQIGIIVASLNLVSHFVLDDGGPVGQKLVVDHNSMANSEEAPLLPAATFETHEHLKGTVAGIYSFAGSVAILILTKVGGVLFDHLGPQAPFYLLALFNSALFLATCGYNALDWHRLRRLK